MSLPEKDTGVINKFICDLVEKSKANSFAGNISGCHNHNFYGCFLQNAYNLIIPELKFNFYRQDDFIEGNLSVFSYAELKINPQNGIISAKLSLFVLKVYFRFLFKWSLMLFCILKSFVCFKNSSIGKGIIIFGLPIGQILTSASDRSLTNFFKQTPVLPLNSASPKFIQCPKLVSVDESQFTQSRINIKTAKRYFENKNHHYSLYPEFDFVSRIRLTFFERLRLLCVHFLAFFRAHFYFLKVNEVRIIFDELACFWTLKELDLSHKIESVIITNSNYVKQPLWLWDNVNFQVHYFYYSTAHLIAVKKSSKEAVHAALELQSLFIAPAKHWVWRKTDKFLLEKYYHQRDVEVVGVPDFSFKLNNGYLKRNIIIFDVNPVKISRSSQLGNFDPYLTQKTLMNFITGIIECADKISSEQGDKFEIILKRKRSFVHSEMINYHNLIREYDQKRSDFTITTNFNYVNSKLNRNTICVGVPFTSASYAVAELGVNSIFFDPESALINPFELLSGQKDKNLTLCSDKLSLEKKFQKSL